MILFPFLKILFDMLIMKEKVIKIVLQIIKYGVTLILGYLEGSQQLFSNVL